MRRPLAIAEAGGRLRIMEIREIVNRLEEIGTLLELAGENPFKVRAYQSGARALESLEEDLDTLLEEERLGQVNGIGKALVEKIARLRRDEELPVYRELRKSIPDGLLEMLEIPGFGPKKIRKVYEELGIASIDGLKEACEDGRVAGLSGFGRKSVENLLRGMENRIAYGKRHLWWDVRSVALPLRDELRGLPQVERAEVAGSFRRGSETVGDLDFIVGSSDPKPIMDWFVGRPEVTEVTAHGETKSSVRLAGGLQADIRVVPDDRYVFALHHFTGSKNHNVKMRQRALGRGYSLSEWGLFAKGDEPPEDGSKAYERPLVREDIREETDLFRALGLAFIAPELREGLAELDEAEAGELPELVQAGDLRGVLHNHTKASDGSASLEQTAREAFRRGWEYVGIADHSRASYQAHGLDAQRLGEQVKQLRTINAAEGDKAYLLAGCEVDILKDGSLDFGRDVLEQLDYCVVSVHASMSGQSEDEMTRRIVRALEADCGCLKILGHPTGRLLLRREPYAVDLRRIIDAAAANGALIELNANPLRMDMDWRHWRLAAEKGVLCAINPDAHALEDFDYMHCGLLAARKAGLTAGNILNSRSLRELRELLERARS